jgi:phospholipid/cholesterol/gamma-HCH transport system permease protein
MSAALTVRQDKGSTRLGFAGDLDIVAVASLWQPTMAAARLAPEATLILDLGSVPECDTAGATMIAAAESLSGHTTILHANEETQALLDQVRLARKIKPQPTERAGNDALLAAWRHMMDGLAFIGEIAIAVSRAPARHRMIPLRDVVSFADVAGVRAIPLVLLLGFLMGLILAFESSIPLKRFGADIFVVNLVTVSLLRELGPLLAAVALAGRTGSAFAAELGTMVVNDEVAAIKTMGIDPVTMLVLPRLLAALLVMPALALLLEVAGLLGMTAVMGVLGFPPVAVLHQTVISASVRDLVGGMVKALAYGAAVAVIGCQTGLAAGSGPRAVGQAATAAVVGGLFATILLDGLFTVLYFRLGL